MGNIPSLDLDDNDVRQLKGNSGLSQHQIHRLHSRYNDLDRRECGELEWTDLARIPELALNPLYKRLFKTIFLEDTRDDLRDFDMAVGRVPDTTKGKSRFVDNGFHIGCINFHRFFRVCSIFMYPKYDKEPECYRLDSRKRKLRFLCQLIGINEKGYLKRHDIMETLLAATTGTIGRGDNGGDADISARRAELNFMLAEVFGRKQMIPYEEFVDAMHDVDVDELMSVRIWLSSSVRSTKDIKSVAMGTDSSSSIGKS